MQQPHASEKFNQDCANWRSWGVNTQEKQNNEVMVTVCGKCGVQASTVMLLLLHCIAKIKENLTGQRCTKFWCYPNVISFKFKCYLPKYSSNRLLKSAVVQAEHVLAAVLGGTASLLVPVFNVKNLCSDSSWDETKESNVCLFHFLASLLTLQSTLSW